jgi:hypothetical protein
MTLHQDITTILKKHRAYSKPLADELLDAVAGGKSDIFSLYEQNIGAITPMVRDLPLFGAKP